MSHRLTHEQVRSGVARLPPLPKVVHELEAALRVENVRTDRIVQAVSTDAAMTTAALRLANSPFYGVSGRVVTLRDAVQILGMHTLSAAVTTAAVMAAFDPADCPGFDFDGSWRHSLATALCAQAIAQARGLDDSVAYTCGLLHDIGSLALASTFPENFSATLAFAARHQVTPAEAEFEVLGVDHAEVGALIATHWRFAPVVTGAIRQHHAVGNAQHEALWDALHLADNITHALDLSQAPDDMVPPLSLHSWERVGLTADEMMQLFERIEARMPAPSHAPVVAGVPA